MLGDGFYQITLQKEVDVENQRPSCMMDLTTGWWRIALSTAPSQNGGWKQGNLMWVKEVVFDNQSIFCCSILVIGGPQHMRLDSGNFSVFFPFVSHSLFPYTPHIVFHSKYLTGMCTLECGRKRIQLLWRRDICKENILDFMVLFSTAAFGGTEGQRYSNLFSLALPFQTEVVSAQRNIISMFLLLQVAVVKKLHRDRMLFIRNGSRHVIAGL